MSFLGRLRNRLLGVNTITAQVEALGAGLTRWADEKFGVLGSEVDALKESAQTSHEALTALSTRLDDVAVKADQAQLAYVEALRQLRLNVREDTTAIYTRQPASWAAPQMRPWGTLPRGSSATEIARIGFLIHEMELINHYASVWDLLPAGSFDVLLTDAADQIENRQVFSRWPCTAYSAGDVLARDEYYRYLVSNHPIELGERPLIKRLGQTNVRFMYAAGKSGWNLSEWNNLYDVIMCFGPYHAANFAHCSSASIVQMGYPRFDRYFNEAVDRAALCQRFGCDPEKPVVVWLPTWKTLSSVGWYDEEISALMDHYNVLVKLHPLMASSEPDRVRALAERPLTRLITEVEDNVPLYQLADFMLFDYGGPPLAAIYTDKRSVLLNVPGVDTDALAGSDSPDVALRRSLVNVGPGDAGIRSILEDQKGWEQQAEVRRSLRRQYFAPHYGISSQVAAHYLQNLAALIPDRAAT